MTLIGHVVGKTMCHLRGAPGLDQSELHGTADGCWRRLKLCKHRRRLTPNGYTITVESAYPFG